MASESAAALPLLAGGLCVHAYSMEPCHFAVRLKCVGGNLGVPQSVWELHLVLILGDFGGIVSYLRNLFITEVLYLDESWWVASILLTALQNNLISMTYL